jgi:hypothetical protein
VRVRVRRTGANEGQMRIKRRASVGVMWRTGKVDLACPPGSTLPVLQVYPFAKQRLSEQATISFIGIRTLCDSKLAITRGSRGARAREQQNKCRCQRLTRAGLAAVEWANEPDIKYVLDQCMSECVGLEAHRLVSAVQVLLLKRRSASPLREAELPASLLPASLRAASPLPAFDLGPAFRRFESIASGPWFWISRFRDSPRRRQRARVLVALADAGSLCRDL